jgi:hypothetical protein
MRELAWIVLFMPLAAAVGVFAATLGLAGGRGGGGSWDPPGGAEGEGEDPDPPTR